MHDARPGRLLWAIVPALLCAVAATAAEPFRVERTERYAADHLIVKFAPGARRLGVAAMEAHVGARAVRRLRSSGAVLMKLPAGRHVDEVIERVRSSPGVRSARRDHYLHIHATTPDDPDFVSCWGLHNTNQYLTHTADADIDAPEAWDITTGSSEVIVAVLDTGVEYFHPDLEGNMWVNEEEATGTPGVDDDGNGYVDDIHGISVLNGAASGNPLDDHGHGTHVAGVLGAVGNNARGMTGVNWTVRIMALKFMDSSGYGLESDAAACLDYAVAMGAKITNNSYGGTDNVQALLDAIAAASEAGVLFCTSAGNDGLDNDELPTYPASYAQEPYNLPNIISVASTGGNDNISYFSNYGRYSVHVGAPGENIWSAWVGGDYQLHSGSSMACPFVAGIAALLKAHEPEMGMAELWERIVWTGDRTPDLEQTTITGLRVNAYNALMGIYSIRIVTPTPLPEATAGTPYSAPIEADGFAPPYTWDWSEPEYVEYETANYFTWEGTARGWNADEGMWRLDLPFSFPFYGADYTHLYVCSNGYVEFADLQPPPSWEATEGELKKRCMIAAYWSDLVTSTAFGDLDIYTWQPGADSMAIRWQAEESDWLLGTPVNCTVVLHADGKIEVHYGSGFESLTGGIAGISNGDEVNYRISKKNSDLTPGWAPTSVWTSGRLPPGLEIDPVTGEIHGTPTTPGEYHFDVHVEDSSGGSDSEQYDLKVYPAIGPRADFSASPLQGEEPLTVDFTDESWSAGGITSREWNFGDSTMGTGAAPSHTYASPGRYTVALTVTDADGTDMAIKVRYIEVFYEGPTVDFTAEPTSGDAPLTVTFTDLSEPLDPGDFLREIYKWSWDFGDGTMQTRSDPDPFDHTYDTPGLYTVTLICEDLTGGKGVETKVGYIHVGGVILEHALDVCSEPMHGVPISAAPVEAEGETDYQVMLPNGAAVALTAPGVFSGSSFGYRFTEWDVGGTTQDPYATQLDLVADQNLTATAHYTRLGDFDKDGDVDFWDFMIFVDVYDLATGDDGWLPDAPIGDFDDDGDVDFWDFMFFVDVYGT